jgi:uncharacterized protein (TIGR03435 family)
LQKPLYCLAVVAVILIAGAAGQPSPQFEVASVKPNGSEPGPFRNANVIWLPDGRMNATGLTLRELVRSAYAGEGIQLIDQIVGGPEWTKTDRFDVVAKITDLPAQRPDDISRLRGAMLKSLLAERFTLKTHSDTREFSVFDLVLADKGGKRGPQLRVSTCNRRSTPAIQPTSNGQPCVPFRMVGITPGAGMTMRAEGTTMPEFAAALVGFPDISRPIRDRTGLTGAFDVQMTIAMPSPALSGARDSSAAIDTGIMTVLQEQLGLKLEGGRGLVNVIVIDSAERPVAD